MCPWRAASQGCHGFGNRTLQALAEMSAPDRTPIQYPSTSDALISGRPGAWSNRGMLVVVQDSMRNLYSIGSLNDRPVLCPSEHLLLFSKSLIGQAKNTTNLGSAREALISNFLVQNLPSAIEYPSGELFDQKDRRSGQIDVILLPQSSPKLHLFAAITLGCCGLRLGGRRSEVIFKHGRRGGRARSPKFCA
jgi:hypothetical protein